MNINDLKQKYITINNQNTTSTSRNTMWNNQWRRQYNADSI